MSSEWRPRLGNHSTASRAPRTGSFENGPFECGGLQSSWRPMFHRGKFQSAVVETALELSEQVGSRGQRETRRIWALDSNGLLRQFK